MSFILYLGIILLGFYAGGLYVRNYRLREENDELKRKNRTLQDAVDIINVDFLKILKGIKEEPKDIKTEPKQIKVT
jgi:hypothetical protein